MDQRTASRNRTSISDGDSDGDGDCDSDGDSNPETPSVIPVTLILNRAPGGVEVRMLPTCVPGRRLR